MAFDSDVKFLNDNVRDTVSPTSCSLIDISEYFRNNNITPTLETVIECIIRLQAPNNRNFCSPAVVRVRELILISISLDKRGDYEDLVGQILVRLTQVPLLLQAPDSPPAFSMSAEMLEGFSFCFHTNSHEQEQEFNSLEMLSAGIPPND
ncbi:hypothetical protein F8M41_014577 [Gigaspora margarita]|uniref:Uncharacterized protein n=1 Tax=Gigaspora margarita TaxID=4874 RepID=A0A8H4B5E6_GIGMA|nr:hypothetical protein F8M41_014577 [Gigaspora margarita]